MVHAMSVVNRMLQDLDKRHAASESLPGVVQSLPGGAREGVPALRWLAVLVLAALAGGAVYLAWPQLAMREPARVMQKPVVVQEPPVVAANPPPPSAPVPTAVPPAAPSQQPALPARQAAPPASTPAVKPGAAAAPVSAPVQTAAPAPPPRIEKTAASTQKPVPNEPETTAAAPAAEPSIEKHDRKATPQERADSDSQRLAAQATQLARQGRTAEARAVLQEALSRDARQPVLAMLLARMQAEQPDLAPAIATLQAALPAAASQPAYRALYAAILQRAGRHAEAAEQYSAAVQLAPANGVWWMGLGISLEAQGQALPAREAFQRARHAGGLSPEVVDYLDQKLSAPLPVQ
jgi:MSHA biogenesis protein MshN